MLTYRLYIDVVNIDIQPPWATLPMEPSQGTTRRRIASFSLHGTCAAWVFDGRKRGGCFMKETLAV